MTIKALYSINHSPSLEIECNVFIDRKAPYRRKISETILRPIVRAATVNIVWITVFASHRLTRISQTHTLPHVRQPKKEWHRWRTFPSISHSRLFHCRHFRKWWAGMTEQKKTSVYVLCWGLKNISKRSIMS